MFPRQLLINQHHWMSPSLLKNIDVHIELFYISDTKHRQSATATASPSHTTGPYTLTALPLTPPHQRQRGIEFYPQGILCPFSSSQQPLHPLDIVEVGGGDEKLLARWRPTWRKRSTGSMLEVVRANRTSDCDGGDWQGNNELGEVEIEREAANGCGSGPPLPPSMVLIMDYGK